MKNLIFFTLALVSIVACKNNTKTENQSVTKEENSVKELSEKTILETGCYEYNDNGSSVKMKITEANENVTGDLNIAYAEKDANQGNFIGTLNGNKLIVTYTFNSEGTESAREMAFLIKDNSSLKAMEN